MQEVWGEISQIVKHLYSRTTMISLLSVKPNLHDDIQDTNFQLPGYLPIHDKADPARNFSYNFTLDDGSQQLPDFPSRTEERINSKNITAKMVSRAIYDASKATGPAIIFKMCSPELSPVFAKLYNKCLAKSCFPSCWKSSSVVPVFKNVGERSDPGKYHPISFLPYY